MSARELLTQKLGREPEFIAAARPDGTPGVLVVFLNWNFANGEPPVGATEEEACEMLLARLEGKAT